MAPEDFDWGSGEVIYWALDRVDPAIALVEQLDELKEDLAQVRFGKDTLLDVGWYPEFAAEGSFVVTIVRDENWDDPLFTDEAQTMDALLGAIERGVGLASMGTADGDGPWRIPSKGAVKTED